jgi:uncharacterized protein
MSIVGLDLAGVEKRPTGFCILKGMIAETSEIHNDEEIIQQTINAKPVIVAIDAPLYLPPGRKNLEDLQGNHLRESDRALLKMGIKIFPPTLGPMRKLTMRGINLRKFFEKRGLKVIEAYPGGAQDILEIPRKRFGIDKLRLGLENLGITGLGGITSDHILDAVTCAYIGKLFLENKAVVYGNPTEGIVLPKK